MTAIFCAGCCQHLDRPGHAPTTASLQTVSVDDLGTKFSLLGRLGKPLGTIVTISGRAVRPGERNDYWSANVAHNLFTVTSVDGRPVNVDIEIILGRDEKFPTDGPAAWIGYEDGSFDGPPDEAYKIASDQFPVQHRGRSFVTSFHALKPATPR